MKKYSYKGIGLIFAIIYPLGGVFVIVFFHLVALIVLVGIFYQSLEDVNIFILGDPRVTIICLTLLISLFSWYGGLIFINWYPTIWLDDEGLIISSFVFYRIRIPWSDVIDVGSGRPPIGHTLVRARKISHAHRVYGWTWSHSLYPGFLIGRDIENYTILINEIKNRIRDRNLTS